MNEPRITAVICTYNRYDMLSKAVASLLNQSLPSEEFEILVIDNSPDRAESETMSKRYPQISNLRWVIEAVPGLSNARNVATGLTRSPLIAFIDDDAIAAPNWLEALIAVFAEFGDDACIVGGRVDPLWETPRPSWLPDRLLGFASAVDWGGTARFASEREWVAGTNIAFRTQMLTAAGGFPAQLGRRGGAQMLLSNDETAVIDKIAAMGGRLVYAPQAIVEHLVSAERLMQSWFRRRAVWQAVSDYLLDPVRAFEDAPGHWRAVTEFFARLPPKYRTPRGFYVEQSESEMFDMQISALYNFTIALLSGFNGLDEKCP
jgi:glycosyltransferase involved in cell wall biosynthesis